VNAVSTFRGAAIRQHVLDMPAPVVADALGYHHITTTRLATHAGATWSRYAPGDHSLQLHREPATVGVAVVIAEDRADMDAALLG